MIIEYQETKLNLTEIPLTFHQNGIEDLFSKKINRTLSETISKEKYLSLSTEVNNKYKSHLSDKLGDFLYFLKINNDSFYKKFLNKYGDLPFCDFSMKPHPLNNFKGIYCFSDGEEIKYIGRSHDPFIKRINLGYGHISPKNCYRDGQSTNCHINSIIAKRYFEMISFFCFSNR